MARDSLCWNGFDLFVLLGDTEVQTVLPVPDPSAYPFVLFFALVLASVATRVRSTVYILKDILSYFSEDEENSKDMVVG
ncbi:hypothetical protein EJB05_33376, partial [Eragrostis curvula]